MDIYADENIHSAIVKGLEERGGDVKSIAGTERTGLSDTEILEYAREEGRIILTSDQDFLEMDPNREHPGLIFLVDQEMSVGKL